MNHFGQSQSVAMASGLKVERARGEAEKVIY